MSDVQGVKGSGSSPGRVRLSSRARPGLVEAALAEALAEHAEDLAGEALVWAALARRHARLVDLAWRDNDVSAMIRGASQLRELLDLLPIRGGSRPVVEEGGSHDGSPRARVLELLDSPPGVGDTS